MAFFASFSCPDTLFFSTLVLLDNSSFILCTEMFCQDVLAKGARWIWKDAITGIKLNVIYRPMRCNYE